MKHQFFSRIIVNITASPNSFHESLNVNKQVHKRTVSQHQQFATGTLVAATMASA